MNTNVLDNMHKTPIFKFVVYYTRIMKRITLFLIIGLLLVGFGCTSTGLNDTPKSEYQTQVSQQNGNNITMDSFAKCLTQHNATMYGALWCSHCNHQKEMFGNSVKYIHFIDCDKYKDTCEKNNIIGYPTWIINGKQYLGVQELETLSKLTGCPMPNK